MNMHMIVLHKIKDAEMLLEKRSSIYSDRPILPVVKLLAVDTLSSLLAYGKDWRKHRQLYQEGLRKSVMPSYARLQTEKVNLMLEQLLLSPQKFREHFKWVSAATVMAMTFGYEYPPGRKNDRFATLAEDIAGGVTSLFLPESTIINIFSFLRHIPPWVPGATTQKYAAEIRESLKGFKNEPFEWLKKEVAAGTAKPSMLASMLQRRGSSDELDDEIFKNALTTNYLAGVETIQSALSIAFFCIALHPEAQKRAQEEIDRVVGTDRLPTFEDRASLPYVEAVWRETLRWRPALPAGNAHASIADDEYNGYFIPKGTVVVPNIWAMTRDEEVYQDADSFLPERFLKADGTLNDDTVDYAFGFGRRICPGRAFAETEIWLAMVSILSTFNIGKAKGTDGVEIDINPDALTGGVISAPEPFACSIVPRSSRAEGLIHDAVHARL
ncbi:hypothetical protein AX14_014287 [Amanita brunnescens Koide BX004]|nr:hypothetical protein AX14_014287 [Amanita brunnescens Koide BX004]